MSGSSSFYVLRVTQDHVQFATRLAAVVGFERALQGTAKRRVQQAPSARAVPGLALQHRRRAAVMLQLGGAIHQGNAVVA